MYVELFNDEVGKPKGSGVIEFRDVETAAKAIEKMHRFEIKDRKLVVREERERDRRQNEMMSNRGPPGGGRGGPGVMGPAPRNLPMGGGGMGGGGMGGMGGANMNPGISPQILQQLGIEGPLTNTVFVSNLDYNVTWRKLKDVFALAGTVVRAEIMEDKNKKSRGMGTVTFETPVEAVQAISMFNNQTLFDRTMRVKMDQPAPVREPLPPGLKSVGPSLTNLMSSTNDGMGMGGSGMGMGGMSGGGMGSMDRMGSLGGLGGMGGGMGAGMGSGLGSGMSAMGSGSMGMGSGMTGAMSGMGSMGSMGSGLGMGMGDNFSSGMSGLGSTSMAGSLGTTGLSDSFGMSSMGTGMGSSSGYNNMMDTSRSSGLSNYGGGNMSSRMDFGRDMGRGGTSGMQSGDMRTRADKSTVIVKNLPYSVDWQTLKSKFQSVGDIRFAEISKNDKGRSNGWGLVSFRREEDAQVAVQTMNRKLIEGREMVVKLLN